MKKWLTFILYFIAKGILAQSVDRYPYVQMPDDTSVVIAWNTVSAGNSILLYGNNANNLSDTILKIGAIKKHNVKISGLQPNTKYYYKAMTSTGYASQVESFYTAKRNDVKNMKFLHYGDCGFASSIQYQIGALMQNQVVDFAIVTGDVDQNVGDDYDGRFFSIYKDMLKQDCHFTAIGNHDTYADNAATYLDAFYLPHNNPANSERYYSFTWGHAKFICLDSNIPYTQGTDQYNWLLEELKCNEKQWMFVYCHHPAWTNYWSLDYLLPGSPYFLYDGNDDMRTSIVPLFEQYGVDFVLNGHTHLYQKAEQNGVKYILSGGSGQDPTTNTEAQRVTHPQVQLVKKINQYVLWDINQDTTTFFCIDKNAVLQDQETKVKTFTDYEVSLNSQPVKCFGEATGSASINIQGSKGPYKVIWSTGDSTFSIANKPAGLYSVQVINKFGCAKYYEVTIEQPTLLTINHSITQPLCYGNNNGKIMVSASGGIAPYTYLWSNNSTVDSIDSLSIGSYTILVKDSNNCLSNDSFVLAYSYAYKPTINAAQNYICNGDSLSLSTSSYNTYNWSTNENNNSINITNAGEYSLTTTDNNGCIGYSDTITIIPDSIASADYNYSITNRQVYVLVNKTADSYHYDFGNGVAIDSSSRGVFYTYSADGFYAITIVTTNRCGNDTVIKEIKIGNPTSGINDINQYQVKLFPVPMTDHSKLIFDAGEKKYSISLTDIQGRTVRNFAPQKSNEYLITRDLLPAGLYFINVAGEINFVLKLQITD